MNRKDECAAKLGRVREMMKRLDLEGVVLADQGNVSWISAGGNFYIGVASTAAAGQILITDSDAVCFTENIEAGRLGDEELEGTGIRVESANWWEGQSLESKIAKIADPAKVGTDAAQGPFTNVTAELTDLRMSLMDSEIERFRVLCARAESAMWETCQNISYGMTEREIAGILMEEGWSAGCVPPTALIAADERIKLYRHPIPTGKQVHERVMIVLGARMGGLIASITRIVQFSEPDADLIKRHKACCIVDATLNGNSRVGADCAEVFEAGCKTYAAQGYKGEWRLHHQGGPAGYYAREIRVTPATRHKIRKNQPMSWNPSITGTKTEDTILAKDDGPEFLTCSLPWPSIEVEACGRTWQRPDMILL
jgi:Xaa-Pro aminopeptidase